MLVPALQRAVTEIKLKSIINKFTIALKSLNEEQAAIMIQKIWKGYKIRKLFKKMMNKLKQKEDDFSDLE